MKNWFKSKTMIFNILTTGAGLLAVLESSDWIMQNPQISAAVLSVVGVINLVLRFFTSEPIK